VTGVTQTPDESRPAPALRIGDAERNAAVDALSEHLAAGRITLAEFSERSATASSAQRRDELIGLFDDLPEPRPVGYPAGHSLSTTGGSSPAVQGQGVVEPAAEAAAAKRRRIYYATMAALPFICTIIAAATNWQFWYIYLLIPLVGALGRGFVNEDDEDQGRQGRNRR